MVTSLTGGEQLARSMIDRTIGASKVGMRAIRKKWVLSASRMGGAVGS